MALYLLREGELAVDRCKRNGIITVTEPTKPLVFMRNPVGLLMVSKGAGMKNLIKTLIFILILAVLVFAVQREMIPFQWQDTMQSVTFHEKTEEDSVDVLVCGTSSVMVGISPLIIYEKAQITAHVRGNSRQPPQVMYLDVKDALRSQNPEIVVCSASMLLEDFDVDREEVRVRRGMDYMPLTVDKLRVAKAITDESSWQTLSSYIMPIGRYHSRWTEIREGLQVGDRNEYDFKHGQYAVYKVKAQKDNSEENMQDRTEVSVTESSMNWYEKTAELCRENGIELLLVTTPDQRWTMGKHEAVAAAAEKLGAGYLDYNVDGITEKCGLDWGRDFYDDHHCNAGGSVKLTNYFTDYLTDNYGLEASDVSEATQKQFEKDIEHFHEVLEKYGFE